MTTSPATSSSAASPFVRKMKRFFLGVLGIILLAIVVTALFLKYADYSEGFRVGTIVKVSKKGFVFKTSEGELNQSFLEGSTDSSATGVATRVWNFTLSTDSGVEEQINHAIEANKKVKAYYKEKYLGLPWVGDTKYIVYKIEEVQ